MKHKHSPIRHSLASLAVCALAVPALAGGTSHWTHSTEADFRKGKFDNVVATNLGDLKLSRAIKTLLEQDPRVSAVYALAEDKDGTIYAATGPQGIVLQLKGEKVSTLATLEDENIFSLLVDRDGKLLIGTGGEKGRILRLDLGQPNAKPAEFFAAEGVQYIWKLVQTPDGNVYAATGPNGQLFEIKSDGSNSVLFDSDENNLLSLISDGGNMLFAGTDPNGLVYRINRQGKDVFVVYDAAEAEVSSLVRDRHGNLYAGTGQASDGDDSAGEQDGASERSGRPDGADRPSTLPSPNPSEPKPPSGNTPGEPDRIPGQTSLIVLDSFQSLQSLLGDEDDDDDPIDGGDHAPVAAPAPRRTPTRTVPGARPLPPGIGRIPGATPPGNAIYRIDPHGFVTEVFRQPGMVLSLLERDGVLIVGTGSEGLVYQVNPAAEETVVLAKVDPKQVTSLLAGKDGRIILGLSNVGGLASMSSGFAHEGTYTSPVLDAGQVSRFGKMRLQGLLPQDATLTVSTRSGNLQEPSDTSWSKWSAPAPATEYVPIGAPPARFFQYRLTFASQNGATTPVVEEVDVAHQVPNLAPQVRAVRIVPAPEMEGPRGMLGMGMRMPQPMAQQDPSKPQTPGRLRMIAWDASDPNNDDLKFSLYLRRGSSGPWVLMEEKIEEPQYLWDTRTAADGRYQIKVVASDVKANALGEGKDALRVSDPVVVDNTPPTIGDIKSTPLPKGAKVQARVVDRTGTVTGVEYSVDSKDDWQAVRASDNIFDSPEEGVTFSVEGLPPGSHQVMIRATDAHGNQSYEAVRVVIGPGQ